MLMFKMLMYVHYFQKNVLYVKTPIRLALIFFHCMNYEAIDSVPFNWVEYCQVKQHMMYVENTVKMHRIQMQICPLFWDGRDDLYCAGNNRSSLWCVSTSPFFNFNLLKYIRIMFLFGILLAGQVVVWFEKYSSEFS